MKYMLRIMLMVLGLGLAVPALYSQKGTKNAKKELKKQQKANAKAVKRGEKYGRKRHLSIQDKATRKRLKQNLRRSNKQGVGR